MLERKQSFTNPASDFDGSRMALLFGQGQIVTRTAHASFDTADHRIASLAFISLAHLESL
jgi:hypothetical protein